MKKRVLADCLSILFTLLLSTSCQQKTETGASPEKPPQLKKSIMWGTVQTEGSVLEKCRTVKAAGFDGVELNSHMDRAEVLEALKETGLVASGVCNDRHWTYPLSSPDTAVRRQGVEAMIRALEDARAYGTDVVLLVPGRVDAETPYDTCWNRSSACIRQLLPTAEKLGVKIAVENVWNNFLLSPLEAARYVDQFDSPWVGFYFDCGNILPYGWPEQWIDILGDRIFRIHVKEFDLKRFETEGKWAGFDVKLLEGSNNWPRIMSAAHKHYTGGWMTTEQGGGDTPDGLADLSQRLSAILQY